jgi:beta-lactamase superfamily II metal-dependent hydrolase
MEKGWVAIALMALLCSCGAPRGPEDLIDAVVGTKTAAKDSIHIRMLDVGQGEAMLISTDGNEAVLIDGGPPETGSQALLPIIEGESLSLKYMIATHYHSDHIGGIIDLFTGPDGIEDSGDEIHTKDGIIDRGEPADGSDCELYEDYARLAGQRIEAVPGDEFRLGDIVFSIVAVNGVLSNGDEIDMHDVVDENSMSIGMVIKYGAFQMFAGGDMTGGQDFPNPTADVETPAGEIAGDVEILKVSHHGSDTGTGDEFLDFTMPEAAIISAGDGNDFSHPNLDTISRLLAHGAEVYTTGSGIALPDAVHLMRGGISIEAHKDGSFTIDEM